MVGSSLWNSKDRENYISYENCWSNETRRMHCSIKNGGYEANLDHHKVAARIRKEYIASHVITQDSQLIPETGGPNAIQSLNEVV